MPLQRYQSQVNSNRRVGGGEGQAQFAGTLVDRLREWNGKIREDRQANLARTNERLGMEAGANKKAGVDIPDGDDIASRSYRKGAMSAHLSAIQLDIRDNIAAFETEHERDLPGFESKLESYTDGLLAEVDPGVRSLAQQEINDMGGRTKTRIGKRFHDHSQREHLAINLKNADAIQQDAFNAAFDADEEMYLKKRDQYIGLLDEGIDSGVLDPAKVEAQIQQFDDEGALRLVVGAFERTVQNEGVEAGDKAIASFKKKKHKDIDQQSRDRIIDRMNSTLSRARAAESRENAKLKAQSVAQERALSRRVKDTLKALGNDTMPDDFDELIDQARGTKHYEKLATARDDYAVVSEFNSQPLSVQQGSLAKLTSKPPKNGKVAGVIERLDKAHQNTLNQLKTGNGLELAVRQGIVNDLPPLNMSDPDSMQARGAAASEASAHYDRPVAQITKAEATQLASEMDDMSADDVVQRLGIMVDAWGADSVTAFEQLSEKHGGIYGVAGSLYADGQIDTAREIMIGRSQLEANPKIITSDYDQQINTLIDGVYTQRPEQAKLIKQSARFLYASGMARARNLNPIEADQDMLNSAVSAITGGIIELEANGSGLIFDDSYNIEAPRHGVDGDMFETWMEGINGDDIAAMGEVSEPDVLAEKINDGEVFLTSLGDGRYAVENSSGIPWLTTDGNLFELMYPR